MEESDYAEPLYQYIFPTFESGIYQVRFIGTDVLLVPIGESTPKVREIRPDVWMRTPLSQRRYIDTVQWVMAENERFQKEHPEYFEK